jgi:hypothetical protein
MSGAIIWWYEEEMWSPPEVGTKNEGLCKVFDDKCIEVALLRGLWAHEQGGKRMAWCGEGVT